MDVTYLAYQDAIDGYQHTDGWTSKDPYWLSAGQTVTVNVASEQQKTVGLAAEYGATEGNTSVTFTACPEEKTPYTWWPGGFLVHGTETKCIRLSVEVAGPRGLEDLSSPSVSPRAPRPGEGPKDSVRLAQ
ncbi:hypothetical protein NIBR502771_16445 [Pseudarthrobacter sp. NIBRBAC000502771]|nr:hypothetical protein NIBR502771_16445 [Pseudarthrobacter sp. NIBRBAC000502771]